jgi:hypothetical protein
MERVIKKELILNKPILQAKITYTLQRLKKNSGSMVFQLEKYIL